MSLSFRLQPLCGINEDDDDDDGNDDNYVIRRRTLSTLLKSCVPIPLPLYAGLT